MVTITLSAAGARKAANRLREFLAAGGINLKQTHAYEALARTLGYANWNTLQALLNETASPGAAASSTLADQQAAPADEPPPAQVVRKPEKMEQRLRLSGGLEQALHRAIGLASARHHEYAALEHLLLSLTEEQDAAGALQACGVDLERLRSELTAYVDGSLDQLVGATPGGAKPTTGFQRVVQRAVLHVQGMGGGEVTGARVLVAFFTESESRAVQFLQSQGLNRADVVDYLAHGKPLGGGPSA